MLLVPVFVVAVALTWVATWQAGRLLQTLAGQVLDQTTDRVEQTVNSYLENAVLATGHAALKITSGELPADQPRRWRPELFDYLQAFPEINSVTFGNTQGDATWMIRYPGEKGYEYAILDEETNGELIEYRVSESGTVGEQISTYVYDPRQRPWYQAVVTVGGPTWSEPYSWVRGNGGQTTLGIAYARPIFNDNNDLVGVIESDISLTDVSRFLAQTPVFETGQAVLMDADRRLLGTSADAVVVSADGKRILASDSADPLISSVAKAMETHSSEHFVEKQFLEISGQEYRVETRPLGDPWGLNWTLTVIVPNEEIMAGVSDLRRQAWLIGGLVVLATLALGIWAAWTLVRPVTEIADAVRTIGEGNLDHAVEVRGHREFEQLSRELNQMSLALKDRMRLRHSLSLAMEIQQKLLPSSVPQVPGLEVAGHSTYCDETGGDYYDFLEVSETDSDELVVVLGDVMGHGVAAALLMATVRGILRSRAEDENSLGNWLTHINNLLVEDTGGERFMTMVLLLVDPATRRVRMASAGHDLPLVYFPNTDSFIELEDVGGLPLGLVSGESYREMKRTDLPPGTLVLVATDGLWESPNAAGEQYGKERICESMRAHAAKSADEIASRITEDLATFRGQAQQDDDITFVLVKFTQP